MSRVESIGLCEWHACPGCHSPLPAGDPSAARRWLDSWAGDDSAIAKLRRHSLALAEAISPVHVSDADLLDLLAQALAAGRMRVCGAEPPVLLGLVQLQPPAARAAQAGSGGSSAGSATPAVVEPELDAAAMAQALRAASASGAALCEECERASRAQTAPAP